MSELERIRQIAAATASERKGMSMEDRLTAMQKTVEAVDNGSLIIEESGVEESVEDEPTDKAQQVESGAEAAQDDMEEQYRTWAAGWSKHLENAGAFDLNGRITSQEGKKLVKDISPENLERIYEYRSAERKKREAEQAQVSAADREQKKLDYDGKLDSLRARVNALQMRADLYERQQTQGERMAQARDELVRAQRELEAHQRTQVKQQPARYGKAQ